GAVGGEAGAGGTLLVAGAVVWTYCAVGANRGAGEADRAGAAAEAAAAREREESDRADAQAREAERNLYVAHMGLAQVAFDRDQYGRLQELLDLHRPRPGEKDLRDWEWDLYQRQCHYDIHPADAVGEAPFPSP